MTTLRTPLDPAAAVLREPTLEGEGRGDGSGIALSAVKSVEIQGVAMTLALSTKLHTSFEEAVERTHEALADQGFGVLTKIDLKAR